MNEDSLLEILKAIKDLQAQHLEISRQLWEFKQKENLTLDDMISVDELKKRYNISDRTYYREKKKGLKAYSFCGRDYLFIAEIISEIRSRAPRDPGT